jgi:hypothetical protein
MINPMQFMQLMQCRNPQQAVMNLLQQQSVNNPILRNVFEMVKSGNTNGIEEMARNLAKEKGINADEAVQQIRKQFGIM